MPGWLPPLLLLLLSAPAGAQTLHLAWLQNDRMEVVLEGRRYVGAWTDKRCFTPECRGIYRNVLRHERQHIRHGEADLAAADGSRLRCTWVSHLPQVHGICTAADGRQFELRRVGGQ